MNLFSRRRKAAEPAPSPQLDEVQSGIEALLRQRMMQGRAATMLASAQAAPTAQREVMGN